MESPLSPPNRSPVCMSLLKKSPFFSLFVHFFFFKKRRFKRRQFYPSLSSRYTHVGHGYRKRPSITETDCSRAKYVRHSARALTSVFRDSSRIFASATSYVVPASNPSPAADGAFRRTSERASESVRARRVATSARMLVIAR